MECFLKYYGKTYSVTWARPAPGLQVAVVVCTLTFAMFPIES